MMAAVRCNFRFILRDKAPRNMQRIFVYQNDNNILYYKCVNNSYITLRVGVYGI